MGYYFDELIISEIRTNNNQLVLGELYKTHYRMIVDMICSNSGTEQEAKDIYQETILAFYERARDPAFTLTCMIKTYLYAVARRLWLKKLSERKRHLLVEHGAESFVQLDDEMETIEERQKKHATMDASVNALGEPCKSIILDYYLNSLSMDDIRNKYSYTSSDNARNQKYKCMQRLRKIFFSHYDKDYGC